MNAVEERMAYWSTNLAFPVPFDVFLEERDDAGDQGRHYAYCEVDDGDIIIAVAPDLKNLSRPLIDGILLHEIGHAIDFATSKARLEMLLGVSLSDDPEERADEIVEYAFGEWVQYERPDWLQCVGDECQGGKRPKGLS